MRLLLSITAFLMIWSTTPKATAQGIFDFNLIDPSNLNGALPDNVVTEAIKMYGIYTAHRPYQGSVPITRYNSFDLNVEATLMKVAPGLNKALRDAGSTSTSLDNVPGIPMAKINLRKALGPNSDIGLSGIILYGQTIAGGDIRIVLSEPEEGMIWALRLGYNYTNVPYAYVRSLNTIQPEIVLSRPLDFAEAYIGFGGRYMWGIVDIPFEGTPPLVPDFNLTKKGSAFDVYAFTGVYFHIIGPQGLRMGIEGSYDLWGYHTLGTVFGIGF